MVVICDNNESAIPIANFPESFMPHARLNLVVIRCANIDFSAAFYAALGLSFTKELHGSGPEHYASQHDGLVFEIYPAKQGSSSAGVRIGFEVRSVDETVAAATQLGAAIVTPPSDSPWGRRAVVSDPDGHRIELSQRLS